MDAQYAATPAKGQREDELPMFTMRARGFPASSGESASADHTAERKFVRNTRSTPSPSPP